jgi:heme/copper-type cytochrome/quinol oxidase subunit 3
MRRPQGAAPDGSARSSRRTALWQVAHVAVGLFILACLIVCAALGRFSVQRHLHVTAGVLYWHFVGAVWLVVFATFFLTPRLG